MKHGTKINWTHIPGYKGETWNPIIGCSHISAGCDHCYAERMAGRLANITATSQYINVVKCTNVPKHDDVTQLVCKGLPQWNGKTHFVTSALKKPSQWKKPRAIFVCSMGDLFHADNPDIWINTVWIEMMRNPQHLYLVLTKRPSRMLNWTVKVNKGGFWDGAEVWPDNFLIGVTAENQKTADKEIPILLQIPAAKRFVSCEPMLSDIEISQYLGDNYSSLHGGFGLGIDWVICGGESGPGARPMHPDWARNLRDQCQAAEVPFFFKQWGEWLPFNQILSSDGSVYNWMNARAKECHIENEKFYKVGKRPAGRLLDGREWKEFPV